MDIIEHSINENLKTIESLKNIKDIIEEFGKKLVSTLKNGNKVLIMGNGGSAADCQHIAAEIVGRYKKERKGFPAIALTTDTSILTALGNDYSFDYIFKRQIEALAVKGDMVIGLSTSGNSANVLEGIKEAKSIGCFTVGLLGKDGGKLKDLVDLPIVIKQNDTPRVQEAHMLIYHIACEIMDENF
ncbi:MAG: phosphoheptose isomerase [Spirochaetes bacterium GWD1_27_9]|nr:MAG: phosphoheptose isomerase [Spirochaetes bacterium GWB1_27_13]OHD27852.1 MAG: phosphoheptose isomerase [Spirochaetes bacterium GWC1_27_15]OHD30864.1 MAG: phosphoheptose isomerase [Spirochaetes bacterium GWD1_27_9]